MQQELRPCLDGLVHGLLSIAPVVVVRGSQRQPIVLRQLGQDRLEVQLPGACDGARLDEEQLWRHVVQYLIPCQHRHWDFFFFGGFCGLFLLGFALVFGLRVGWVLCT